MSKDLEKAVESLYSEMDGLHLRLAEIKKTINSLSALMGKNQPFADVDYSSISGNTSIRPDQFFGKGLATSVKEFLKIKGRAVTAQEIYDSLKSGGFEFPKEWKEKFQMRNLTISLSKNSNDFVYVKSSNAYGLWEFYPEKKREKGKQQKNEEKMDVEIVPLESTKITEKY
jgi:hypothetical protein